MKKIHMFAALLAMLLPTVVFGAGTANNYARLTAMVSTQSSGMGKVYADKSTVTTPGTFSTQSQSQQGGSSGANQSYAFNVFAQAETGYEFLGWSETDGGAIVAGSAVSPWTPPAITAPNGSAPNTGSKDYFTDKTYFANFQKMVLPSFSITFETSSAGTYTVDGAAPANKTGLTEATSVVLDSSDSNFLNWVINGTVVNNKPYTASCTTDTTISADFLTADQVTTVITLSDLTAALSNAAYKKITIPSGTSITVAKGSTVTVPAGKQLVVDGTLNVLGTLSNSGAISGSGTLYKISYSIDQGEVITIKTADGKECGAMACTCQTTKMPRYCKTTVTANTPSVNGTIGCQQTWGVLLNGATAYAISKQDPKAVKVNVDTATDANGKQSVVNKITSVVVNGDVDEVTENKVYVLFANCSVTGPIVDSKLDNQGVVDCAGKTLSASKNSHSSFGMSVLNGSVSFSASQWQNAHAAFFNMSSVSLSKVKGTGSTYYFYDCGTKTSPCSVSISYYSNTRTSDYKSAYFYSGYYSYSFNTTNDSGTKCNVYGGFYTSDPASYIPTAYDGILQSKYDGSKYYVVTDYTPPAYVCAVGGVEYESLPEAVAAAGNGSLITLSAAIELDETLTIPVGKNITISLEKRTIQGGKIVNNGTLTITDAITGNGISVTDVSGGIVKCDIENNGTLDFIFGSYTGAIVNKAGTLTTHNGLFSGTFAKNGGTVNLKGGHFTTDVSSLVTADGYDVITYGGKYSVCELPDGTLYDTTVSSTAGYGATPYGSPDIALLKKWVGGQSSRTNYSASEWPRLAELLCFYQVFNNKGLDPTLIFDRDVARDSINLYAKSGSLETPVNFDFDVTAGTPYRALSEFLNPQYASKTFKAIFDENITSVGVAVADKSGNNAGTLCKAMVELWEGVRAPDYSSTRRMITNTVYVVGQKLFAIDAGTNKAMIRPATGAATFYATLGAAMDAAADGGTVMLANDCDTALPLTKAGTYTFDTMGFAASDTVSVSDGLFVKSETTVDSSARVLVPDAKATTYVVGQKVASVGGTFYESLAEAVAEANGAVVTLLAATDETITLGEGQSLKLTVANGVSFNDSQITTSVAGCVVSKTVAEGVATYAVTQNVVESNGTSYPSVAAAIAASAGDDVSVTVTAATDENIELSQGKTLTVTVNDGVTANVTVTPATGAFIETATEGATTTHVSKKITVEMAEPQTAVEVTKIENGEETAVSDSSAINAAVDKLMGNDDVPRTDNTDKLDVLDKIAVTPQKIVLDENGKIKSATFDVTPALNAGQSLGVGQKLKFRLPVDAAATQLASIVYHNGAQFGIYPVQTVNAVKFIEVESDAFSPYGYELLDGETANPVAAIGTTGYASLAAAVAAAEAQNPEPTIVVLDTTVTVPTGWQFVTEGSVTTLVRTVNYNVWVGGTQITSANAADVFGDGKVSYDDATKTLTLNGYTYSGAGYGSSAVYIGDMGGATFNVVVAGENSLTSTAAYGYAIRSVGTGAVTVTGSGSDPSLVLTVPSAYDTGYAVSVKGTSATFKDLSMAVTGYLGIVVNGNNAAGDALTIDNCDIVFDGTAIDQAIWVFNEGGDGTVSIENGSSLTGKGAILVYGYGTSAGDANLSITDSTVSLTGATTASASGSSRHAIEVLSNVGDSVLTIDNSTVTVTASNGLHPNGNGPDGINVGSQMSANGKGLAKIDIKNGSVVTATGNANGVNLFTWGDSSNVNPCGAELSVVDSTLNASATHATGGHYGIVAYAYQKGDTSVVFENSTVNASAPVSAGIYLGAGEDFNADVGNLSYEAIDSDVTTSGPYGLVVSTVSDDGCNTSAMQTVDINGGTFTCNGLLFVYGDDGENTASVSMSDVTAQIGTTTATEEPVLGTITTGELSIDSGDYTILHAADLDAFDAADGNISGGNFNEQVPEELCANTYIPTPQDPVTGKYTVKVGSYVAQIGDVKYETFAEAIAEADEAVAGGDPDPVIIALDPTAAQDNADWKFVTDDSVNPAVTTLVRKVYVAQIVIDAGATTNKYETLAEAVAVAQSGGTVTLLADVTVNTRIDMTAPITIDFNGKTITSAADNRVFKIATAVGEYTFKNGTVNTTNPCYGLFRVDNASTVTVEGITTTNGRSGGCNFRIAGGAQVLVTNCTITATNGGGVYAEGGSTVNVYDSTIAETGTATDCNASAFAVGEGATITVHNGTYSGEYGAFVCSSGGTVEILDGSVTGRRYAIESDARAGGNEDNSIADSIIRVAGGTIDGELHEEIQLYNNATLTYANKMQISGGMFRNFSATGPTADNAGYEISGGIFDAEPAAQHIVDGSVAITNPDSATVASYPYAVAAAVAQVVRGGNVVAMYESLVAAYNASQAGDTIELLADDRSLSADDNAELTITKSITITGPVDANGDPLYTIYGKNDSNGYNDIFIRAGASDTVTISNVNVAQFGNQASLVMDVAPIYVGGGNAAKVILDNVHISEFLRIGVVMSGSGEFEVRNCYIDGTRERADTCSYGIEVHRGAHGVIADTTIENISSTSEGWGAACMTVQGQGAVSVTNCTFIGGVSCDGIGTTENATEGACTSVVTIEDSTIDADCAMGMNVAGSQFVVKSGTYGGYLGLEEGIANAAPYSISGGMFEYEVPEEFCADGYIPTPKDPVTGMYTVKQGSYVAQIGTTKYETFAEAIAAADAAVAGGGADPVIIVLDATAEQSNADWIFVTDSSVEPAVTTLVRKVYVAQILRGGEVIAKYESFDEALDVAESGDTVQLLADVTGVTTTYNIDKTLTIDGQGQYTIVAGENTEPRSVVAAWGGSRVMFDMTRSTANVTFKDITLDNGEGHYYTFLAHVKNGTTTFDDVTLLNGGEADASDTAGVGYGAAIQVDGGNVIVNGDFYADSHGEAGNENGGIFPFTAILYQTGVVHFNDGVDADIGKDLLIVGMVGAVDVSTDAGREQVNEMLAAMNVPAGYYPYTLKLGDSEMTSFTGASPLGWNGIIDYGTDIMTAANTSMGMDLDPDTTPVEVGLLADTDLPETFMYEDSNLKINGNGNAISGTIEYTDDAGTMENVVMGTDDKPLVLDMTGLSEGNAINLGSSIAASNVTIKVTEEQATTLGQAIVTWNTEGESDEDAASLESGVKVEIVDKTTGQPVEDPVTGEPMDASIIWDAEMGVAYIGPCEARLTGPTHESPIYTSLASAIARAAQTGDTVTLMTNVVNVSDTYTIAKQDLVIDGAGYSITAAPVSTHRDIVHAWAGSKTMFKIESGAVTFQDITLDGDATHAYTFLISADNSSITLTTENIRLLNGGELCGDANGDVVEPGAGYGAAVHLNNGAHMVISNGFYVCTGGKTAGCFPFTGILVDENGGDVKFELTGDPNDPANVDIGSDLLLVGMPGIIPLDQTQDMLDYMKVPSRFIPYTLTLDDGSAYAFTGASPLGWNEIIDYGKEIMEVSTAIGYDGLDKDTTPVEVGLLTDTELPDTFTFEDPNFTVNGNGNALSGTIKYTDDAGLIENIVMGTDENPLVIDITEVTQPIEFGAGVAVTNVTIKMTEKQAELGTPIIIWDVASGVEEPENPEGVSVAVVDNQGEPTGDTATLIWDEELGLAYIGPCDARLTGPTHDMPIYTTLSNAIERAVATGDTVTLMTNVTLAARQTIDKSIEFCLNGKVLTASGDAIRVDSGAAVQMFSDGTVTGNIYVASGTLTITNGIYVGTLGKADSDGAQIAVSGGHFANPVLQEYCADGYSPVMTTASEYAATPHTVARVEIIYPTAQTVDGLDTVGIPIPVSWVTGNTDLIGASGLVLEELDDIVTGLGQNGENGVPLWQSYVLGFDPNDATNQLRLEGMPATADGMVTIKGLGVNVPAILESQGTTVGFHLEEAAPGTAAGSNSWTVRNEVCTMAEGLPTFSVPVGTVNGKVLRIVADIATASK